MLGNPTSIRPSTHSQLWTQMLATLLCGGGRDDLLSEDFMVYVIPIIETTISLSRPRLSLVDSVTGTEKLINMACRYDTFLRTTCVARLQLPGVIIVGIYTFLTPQDRIGRGLRVCKYFFHGLTSFLAQQFWISDASFKRKIILPCADIGSPNGDPPLVFGSRMCVPYLFGRYAVVDQGLQIQVVRNPKIFWGNELRAWNGYASLWVHKVTLPFLSPVCRMSAS